MRLATYQGFEPRLAEFGVRPAPRRASLDGAPAEIRTRKTLGSEPSDFANLPTGAGWCLEQESNLLERAFETRTAPFGFPGVSLVPPARFELASHRLKAGCSAT